MRIQFFHLLLFLSLCILGTVSAQEQREQKYFNEYILKAIDYLDSKYGRLGYANDELTHDIVFGDDGTINATNQPLTMCVAAQLEIILTAYDIYARETGDIAVYQFLPKHSYEGLSYADIKGHIWVNGDFNSNGTADALINFGMGERIPFSKLKPGAFININRTNGSGHAVTFLGYINEKGDILDQYGNDVVGFKYYSSQGKPEAGKGGLDYRYAIFSKFGCTNMPYLRDCGVIYSTNQSMLTTGMMLLPKYWHKVSLPLDGKLPDSRFDDKNFTGVTTDD